MVTKDSGHIPRKDLWVVFLRMCEMAAEANVKRYLFLPSLFLCTYQCQAGGWEAGHGVGI